LYVKKLLRREKACGTIIPMNPRTTSVSAPGFLPGACPVFPVKCLVTPLTIYSVGFSLSPCEPHYRWFPPAGRGLFAARLPAERPRYGNSPKSRPRKRPPRRPGGSAGAYGQFPTTHEELRSTHGEFGSTHGEFVCTHGTFPQGREPEGFVRINQGRTAPY
jgi:hypothetical protein